MPYVLFEEANCEGALLDASRDYRVILGSSSDRSQVKSKYVSSERGGSAGRDHWRWTRPFGNKIHFPALPLQLTVTLHRRGRFRHGPDVATYNLVCSSDCTAEAFVLSHMNSNGGPNTTIRLVVTISGNLPGTSQDVQVGSSQALKRENPSHVASYEQPTLEAKAEADTKNAYADLIQVNPTLSLRLNRIPSNQVPGATDAVAGLASILSNLEGFVMIADLLADIHPLVRGAWSLVNAAYQVARALADLDNSVAGLIDAMDHGCKLAKAHAPLKGRHSDSDFVVQDILREVIRGASILNVYCEKRPQNLAAIRTLGSNLALKIKDCTEALLAAKQKLLDHTNMLTLTQIAHVIEMIDRNAASEDLKELRYAVDANRALFLGSRGCLAGTRAEVLDGSMDWAIGAPRGLSAPTGAGKSSIAISLAKALHKMDLLGSLYSFQAANQATWNPTNLFSTIVRHFAEHDLSYKQRLVELIRKTDSVTRATLSPTDQFEKFFLALLAGDEDRIAVEPIVIIIDAFDECGNIGGRKELLDILTRRAHELPTGVRLIVTSRYEADVQEALESRPRNVCFLKMEHIPKSSTEHDINAYVHDTLEDIQGVDAESFVPELTKLAVAAEESFQWASTACLFIMNEDDGDGVSGPEERLSQVLRTKEGLDDLYRTVLDRHFGATPAGALEPVLTILGCLVCAREPLHLQAIASLKAGTSTSPNLNTKQYHRITRKLSSLVTGTHDLETPLVALHTSFTDFLRDKKRSHKYFTDTLLFHRLLAERALDIMSADLYFNICKIPTSFKPNDEIENIKELIRHHIPAALSYACRFWTYHLSELGEWTESEALRQSVTTFLSDRFLEWLEVMSLTGNLPTDSLGYLQGIHQIPYKYRRLYDLIHDASQFGAHFAAPIMKSVSHIYLSALPFTPTKSPLHHLLEGFRQTMRVISGSLVTWPNVRHILEGHSSGVKSVAFSPIRHLIVSGSRDGTIQLWDSTKGLLNVVLEGHSGPVNSVAFSSDGTLVASGGQYNTIQMWDVTSGTAIGKPLKGHTGGVQSVAFSPDGTLLASGSEDGTIRIWDVASRTAVGDPLNDHGGCVNCVAFSPDGMLIASSSDDRTIRIWDVASRTAVGEPMKGHISYVFSVAFSSDGALLGSGSADSTIRIWNVASRTAVGDPLQGHTDFVRSVAFSSNGALIASASDDKTVRTWDVTLGTEVGEPLEGHTAYVLSVAFSPNSTLLASGSDDSTIRVWDVRPTSIVEEPSVGHISDMKSVAFSPNNALAASGSGDRTIPIWDVMTRSAIGGPLEGHARSVQSVAFSPDGSLLASGSGDKTIRIWDVASRTTLGGLLAGHTGYVRSVTFSPDGTLLASGSDDRTIRIWDVRSRLAVGEPLEGHIDYVRTVAFSPNGTLLASGSDDGTIRIWDVRLCIAVGAPLKGHTNWVWSVALSPNGALIASCSDDKTIRIWDIATHAAVGEPMEGHADGVLCVAFSPNSALIASGSIDKTIRIWDLRSRTEVGEPLTGHTSSVQSVAFSPDGTVLVSGSDDRTIRIWSITAHTAVGESLYGHNGSVYSIVFSPRGTLIASGSDDRTVRIWDICAQTPSGGRSPKRAEPPVVAPSEGLPPSHHEQSLAALNLSLISMRHLVDGWIVGPQRELVLWIPPSQRLGLGEHRMLAVLGNPNVRHTLLDFDLMACGSDWAKCRTTDSADSAVQSSRNVPS